MWQSTYLLRLVFSLFLDLTHLKISPIYDFNESYLFLFKRELSKTLLTWRKTFNGLAYFALWRNNGESARAHAVIYRPIKNYFEWTVNQEDKKCVRTGQLNKEQSRGLKFPFESKSRKLRSVSKAKKKNWNKMWIFRGNNISTLSIFRLVFLYFLSLLGEGED